LLLYFFVKILKSYFSSKTIYAAANKTYIMKNKTIYNLFGRSIQTKILYLIIKVFSLFELINKGGVKYDNNKKR
jgi:hypothetical protein